jgi:hypothetical protein
MESFMKRLFIATGIFGLGIFLLLLPTLVRAIYAIWSARATGKGIHASGMANGYTLVAGLALLMLLSYWLSGKLVKARTKSSTNPIARPRHRKSFKGRSQATPGASAASNPCK